MHPTRTTTISDTVAHLNISCFAFTVLEDAVFTDLANMGGTIAGVTYPSLATIFGNFSSLQLASGKIVIYER